MQIINFKVILKQKLPDIQLPEVFGMHDNVDISKEMLETRDLFENVLLTLGSGEGGSSSSKSDELLYTIAGDILSKVSIFDFMFYRFCLHLYLQGGGNGQVKADHAVIEMILC